MIGSKKNIIWNKLNNSYYKIKTLYKQKYSNLHSNYIYNHNNSNNSNKNNNTNNNDDEFYLKNIIRAYILIFEYF